MIKVNGENRDGFAGKTLSELLCGLGYKELYIAVELNGDIVKKDSYGAVILKDGDCLEVVSFVGGG